MIKEYSVSVLIVDDDFSSRKTNEEEVRSLFSEMSTSELNIKTAHDIDSMYVALDEDVFHVILLDRDLGRDKSKKIIDGIQHIQDILEIQPNAKILVVTSFLNPQLAVEAIKKGAINFLNKGYDEKDFSYRKSKILKALKSSKYEIDLLKKSVQSSKGVAHKYPCISRAMKNLDRKIEDLAKINVPVLITGDPGLGKTHAAKRLNELSQEYFKQKERPLSNININTLSSKIVESELFGHKKGAFTGAINDKQGIFSLALSGDVFLDEIGDSSLELQGKLLKVLDEKVYRAVGGNKDLKTNARVIMATNKNLEKLIEEGKFRQDLYDRISAFDLKMPELNQRKEDIPLICQAITNKLRKEHSKGISYTDFPEELKTHFIENEHKGNIRGIQNQILQLVSYCPEMKSSKKLNYGRWKFIIYENQAFKRSLDPNSLGTESLLKQLAKRIGSKDWPGLMRVKELVEILSIKEAYKRFPKNTLRAQALGVSEATVSVKTKEYVGKGDKK